MGLDAQAQQEAAKRRGKIPTTGTSNPSGISVEGEERGRGRKARGTRGALITASRAVSA